MNLASLIDHTNLKPEATSGDIANLVREAIQYRFASVCVHGRFVEEVRDLLKRTVDGVGIHTCGVVGFPHGCMKPSVKITEAVAAVKDGADEIDFVAYLPNLIARDVDAARAEFMPLVEAVRNVSESVVVKVIIESALLMRSADARDAEHQIATACVAAVGAGCDFVKTSTGFHPAGGATVEAVRLMKKHAMTLKVKAAGGIRTRDDVNRMINAGADRIGCSSSVAIMNQR